ncbi:hypothetical protein NDGK_01522 [Clostridiales bacterium CHKCI001]|nr:hypothetical protein NDGK_01522 [Clostridiales bacterium CHKCI001]
MKRQYNSPRIYFENIMLNTAIANCDIYQDQTGNGGYVIDEGWVLFFDIDGNPCTDTPDQSNIDDNFKFCYHVSVLELEGWTLSAVS